MDGLVIFAKGRAAHASVPEQGLNSAAHLIRILADNFGESVLGSLCGFLDNAIGTQTDGEALGISCSDEKSGNLTVNLGRVDIGENISRALIDIRYPVSANGDEIFEKIRRRAEAEGLNVKMLNHEPPLFTDSDNPIISVLSDAYESVTGVKPELYSTGGGTYARTLGNRGVAFGPAFSGDETHIHDVNEGISAENFWKHAKICAQAVYLMSMWENTTLG